MKIESVRADLFRLPLATPLSDATHGEMASFEFITVRIQDDQGREGLGYTYTTGAGGVAILDLIDQCLKPDLLGQDAGRIEYLWQRMWWRLHYAGRGGSASFAISAIDIALWDLAAKRQGEPLWRFLGGYNPRVRVYAGGVDLEFTLEALKEQAQRFIARGFGGIKMKVGRPRLSEDLARVAAIRKLIGPDMPLMVDTNMGWTAEQSIRASRAMAEFDIYWLEEPIIPDDLEGHIRIAREGALPIATGENFHTLYEFQKFIAAGAVSFPEVDVSNCGGISIGMKVARLAEAFNLPVTTHGVHDLHVHLLAAIPNASFLEAHGFGLEAYLRHPLQIEKGEAIAADRPGHGVILDWEKMEPYRVR